MKSFTFGLINIEVDERWAEQVPTALLAQAATTVLQHEEAEDSEVTLVIAGGAEVHALNRDFRGVDTPTDVLSFPAHESQENFVSAPEAMYYLGDVIIAYPVACEQAAENNVSAAEELVLLVIHGLLHLLGYGHDTPEGEEEMFGRQKMLLAQCVSGGGVDSET